MFVRAYLRASTEEQDASRAKQALVEFADANGQRIASFYIENESGSTLKRPELMRLLDDCQQGDVLLVEQVDRLSRLTEADWNTLRGIISSKGISVVSLDLPTSHGAMGAATGDEFTRRMLGAINGMMLDMLAAVARKDYTDRKRRQAEGIKKAANEGRYKGRPANEAVHNKIRKLRDEGKSFRQIADYLDCSLSTVQRALKAS